MQRFLETFDIPGAGTFFLARRMDAVEFGRHEVEPHPVFDGFTTWQEQLERSTADLGTANLGMRCHSCVYSHMVGVWLGQHGFQYITNATPLFQDGLKPYRHPWGLWELPIYYMDNMDFCMWKNWPPGTHEPFQQAVIETAVNGEALFVFDFHPLHIAMNTTGPEKYSSVKEQIMEQGVSPFDLTFTGRGVRTFYEELCEAMDGAGRRSYTCMEALKHFGCLQ